MYYDMIAHDYPGEENVKSVALRFVIHYIGDIVQPLHNVSRVDSKYPAGD